MDAMNLGRPVITQTKSPCVSPENKVCAHASYNSLDWGLRETCPILYDSLTANIWIKNLLKVKGLAGN